MKKSIIIILLLLVNISNLLSQNQSGLVVIQNSGRKTLPQVEIIVLNAQPTTSDAQGSFQIHVPNHVKGQRLLVQKISYKDWIVVNKHSVEQWVYAPEKKYRIDMCPKEDYNLYVEKLFEIGENSSRQLYNQISKELNDLKAKGILSNNEYMLRLKKARTNLKNTKSMLDEYIPLIAAINKDYLMPAEQQAQQLIMEGKLNEAIQIYEDLNLIQKVEKEITYSKNWSEYIESLIPTVERFAQTLILKGGEENYNLAGKYLKKIADYNPKHMQRNANYAIFANKQNMYSDAETYFKRALKYATNSFDKIEWHIKLGTLYDNMNNTKKSIDEFIKATDLLEKQPKQILATVELTVHLNINMSKLLFRMSKNQAPKDKKKSYQLAHNCLEEAQTILETLKDTVMSDYEHALTVCYNNSMNIYAAEGDIKGLKNIQKKMRNLFPTDVNDEAMLEWLRSEGANLLHLQQYQQALEKLLQAKEIIDKLYVINPQEFKFLHGNIYSLLGNAYFNLNQYHKGINIITEGLATFNTFTEYEKELQKDLFYDLHYNLIQCYFYNNQFYEIIDLFPDIYPYMNEKDQKYDTPLWMYFLYSSYTTGKFDILKHEQEILKTLKMCEKDKLFYSHVEAAYTTLGALKIYSGHFEDGLQYYNMSDMCAKRNKHKLMIAYGKLNRLAVNLIQHNPETVLSQYYEIKSELKKYGSDYDAFAQLSHYNVMANMMLHKFDEANMTSKKFSMGLLPKDKYDRCKVYLSQILLNIFTGKPYLDWEKRFNEESMELLKTNQFKYWEIISDFHISLLNVYIQKKNLVQTFTHMQKALEALERLGKESYCRMPFMLSYIINKLGDIEFEEKNYESALKSYEDAISIFYAFHHEKQIKCYTYMYEWNTSLLFDDDILNFEKTIRNFKNAQNGMVQQAFFMALFTLGNDEPEAIEFIQTLKTRKIPDSKSSYAEIILKTYKNKENILHKKYIPTIQRLFNLLK